ncbi:hypothetical protein K1X76_10600 [bacterium]|nr:hypothetical protein [bacterium]
MLLRRWFKLLSFMLISAVAVPTTVGYLGMSGIFGCAPPPASSTSFPETCAEARDIAEEEGESVSNGPQILYVDGNEDQPWDAYCNDMSRAEPAEYLDVNPGFNKQVHHLE